MNAAAQVGDWVVVTEWLTSDLAWPDVPMMVTATTGGVLSGVRVCPLPGHSRWATGWRSATPEELASAQLASLPGGQL